MLELLTITELSSRIGEEELLQIAGVGDYRSEDGRMLDEDRINEEIHTAEGMVGGYLMSRYPAVFEWTYETTPDLVKGYTADIVRYRLRARSGDRNTVTEEVRQRFEDARSWLKDIANGRANLVLGGETSNQTNIADPSGTVQSDLVPARAPDVLRGY